MSLVELLVLALGLVLVAIAAVDLFGTVLEYGGYGPVSRRLNQVMWSGARAIGTRFGRRRRDEILAIAGPLILVGTIGAWVAMTWLGFALVYLPFIPERFVYSVPVGPPFVDALYFSVVSLSTVGFGNIVAAHPALQLASALEALAGFTILTLTISYILGVYGVLRTQSTVAAMIDDRSGGSTDPLTFARVLLRGSDPEGMLDTLHRELLSLQEGMHRYPIVHYFRRRLDRRSSLYVLRMTGEAAASLRWGLSRHDSLTSSPALAALVRAERRIVEDLQRRFLTSEASEPAARSEALRHRFAAAVRLREMRDGSGRDEPDGDAFEAWADYVGLIDDVTARAGRKLAFDEREIGAAERT